MGKREKVILRANGTCKCELKDSNFGELPGRMPMKEGGNVALLKKLV